MDSDNSPTIQPMWLWSIWIMINATEELNLSFYLILINFKLKNWSLVSFLDNFFFQDLFIY